MKKQNFFTLVGSSLILSSALLLVLLGIGPSNAALASESTRFPEKPLTADPGDVLINELDADQTSTDSAEFIELYDGGHGNTLLDGLVVVLFNGNGDVSYNAFDLDDYTTDGGGYFVICGNAANVPNCDLDVSPDTNLIQNDADAAALYIGDVADFPNGTAVTSTNLVDAIVYDTDDPDDAGLLDVLLNPGQPQVNERGGGSGTTHSNQRCPNGSGGLRNTDTYIQETPTSGATNNCRPDVAIDKIGPTLTMPGDFVTYTVTYANDGTDYAHNVIVSDTLPIGVSYVSDNSGLSCPACSVGATDTLTWYVGTITPTGNFSLTLTGWVTGSVPFGSTLTNTVEIATSDAEITTTNNTGKWVTSISVLDLIVDKEGPAYAVIGENVVYAITLNNQGVTTATNVILTDTLPVSTTYVSDDSGIVPTQPVSGIYVWAFGDVPSNTVSTFNLTVTMDVSVTSGTVLTNTVEASTDTTGDNPANNTVFWTTTACPLVYIHDIQGSDLSSPMEDEPVIIEGVVVGDFQDTGNQLGGFFVQEEDADADADPLTSEGIFIYDDGLGVDVNVGDVVRVQGDVNEYRDLTRLTDIDSVVVISSGVSISPTNVMLPLAAEDDYEPYEGMLVAFPQDLTVTEVYYLGRYGQVSLSQGGRLFNPTNVITPGVAANDLQAANDLRRLVLDDGNASQNSDPVIYPSPGLSATNTLRTGYTVTGLTGVLDAYYDYRLQPTTTPTFVPANPRTAAPATVGGTLSVASFNVLNYFTTIDTGADICGPTGDQGCRGADSTSEFTRQRDKIINAIATMDADVVGLMEIENNAITATQDLVDGLNAVAGAGTYDYVDTGTIGDDVIKVAFIYQPGTVTLVGSPAILDSSVDPQFNDELNRPALAQTFEQNGTGERFTAVVNHFKSKSCYDATGDDADQGDGQGCWNATRTDAATALANWLATDPTGSGDPDFFIIGDLNSYAKENPIAAIEGAGYANLLDTFVGVEAYSYVYAGQSGYLDHALSSNSLTPQVVSATVWHINTDEPIALDYNEDYKSPGHVVSLYNDDPYRASDHDPVIVGLDLASSYHIYLPLVMRGYPPPPSALKNGDFENGSDGSWTEYSSLGYPIIVDIGWGHDSTWAAWLGGDEEETSEIFQYATVPPDSPWLHYWYWTESDEDSCEYDAAYVSVNDTVVRTYNLCYSNDAWEWVHEAIDLSEYAGQTVKLTFRAEVDEEILSVLAVDDVSFEASSSP